jgi:hypothetical protein
MTSTSTLGKVRSRRGEIVPNLVGVGHENVDLKLGGADERLATPKLVCDPGDLRCT